MAAMSFFRRIGFLTPLAGLNLILVLIGVLLSFGNQALRLQVTESQQFITQSIQLEGLHQEIVATIARAAVQGNDRQLRELLASHGINLVDPGAAGGAE